MDQLKIFGGDDRRANCSNTRLAGCNKYISALHSVIIVDDDDCIHSRARLERFRSALPVRQERHAIFFTCSIRYTQV
jgi:hypothetical protein